MNYPGAELRGILSINFHHPLLCYHTRNNHSRHFFLCIFSICQSNFHERSNDEDSVEKTNDKHIETTGYSTTDAHSTTSTPRIDKESNEHNHWYEETSESPPSLKYFVSHFVGDEGEEEDKREWRKRVNNNSINIFTNASVWSAKII